MGKLHDRLKEIGYDGHPLEVYLVRILFCLFAEDTTIFEKQQFQNYIEESIAAGRIFAVVDLGLGFGLFQSTPGIAAGRIVQADGSFMVSRVFQSTPGIAAGRIEIV